MISCRIRRLNNTLPFLTQIPWLALEAPSKGKHLSFFNRKSYSCKRRIRDFALDNQSGKQPPRGFCSLSTNDSSRRSLDTQKLSLNYRLNMTERTAVPHFFPQTEFESVLKVTSGDHPIVEQSFEKLLNILTSVEDDRLLDSAKWIKKVAEYNVPQGKRNRLVAVMLAYQSFASSELTTANLEDAAVLGWCVELLQAFFLISDDIMDNSITRRGRPCWYKVQGVNMMAVNDAILLESAIYLILKKLFRSHPNYLDLLDLFHEVTFQTASGQCLDLLSERQGGAFLEERYDAIVLYKTAFYSFSLPVRLGMYLAGITDTDSHKRAEQVSLKIGHIFQVQDDYLDCYGDPEKIGKVGTDIVDAKCSWLVVKALQTATEEQKTRLLTNYGKGEINGTQEAEVKKIYGEINLQEIYRQAEKQAFEDIRTEVDRIGSVDSLLKPDIFKLLVNNIYRREK